MSGGGELDEQGYDNYVPSTVNPGSSMIILTVLYSAFLICLLPFLLAIGKRWKLHRKSRRDRLAALHSNETSAIESRKVDNNTKQRVDENDDNESVSSKATGISNAASTLLNAILDSSPRGGPNLTRNQVHLLSREHALETEEQTELYMKSGVSAKDNDAHSVANSSIGHGSILDQLDHDAVSVHDAVDAPVDLNAYNGQIVYGKGEKSVYCCSPSRLAHNFDKLLVIAEWDYESKRICKLGLPFLAQSLFQGIAEAVRVALVGRLIGTEALSVYIVVDLMVGVTTQLMRGFQDALITLCSQSLGVGNKLLTGQYLQMTVIMYLVVYIPIFVFWYYFIGPTIIWFGLSQSASVIGHDFAILYLLAELIKGLDASIHALLDCIGCENYSTSFTVGLEVAYTISSFVVGSRPSATIQHLGYCFVTVFGVGLVVNVVIVLWNGWFDPYLEGIIGTFSFRNVKAVKLTIKTTCALCFGYLLTNGEWEILTIFTGFLGPAEVAAWGILGALWDALEFATEAIADAAEVRTAFLLGAGQPAKAKLSSYKSLYIGLFVTLLITSCLFIGGDHISTWMTHDHTLQHMVSDLIPLFGIGNIALSLGTMSWTLVGAQGRYRLATSVGFAGSWVVTLPLAALFSMVLNYDLQAQTAAIVIGYMTSGTLNSYILFQSDWEKLSRRVIEYNAEQVEDDSDDDSSSSSSSSNSESSSSSVSESKLLKGADPVAIYNNQKTIVTVPRT